MNAPANVLPACMVERELPERPDGWTRRMTMHTKLSRGGGFGCYNIHDDKGISTPITYQYRTGKEGFSGFFLDEIAQPMNWGELRAVWPGWLDTYFPQRADAVTL